MGTPKPLRQLRAKRTRQRLLAGARSVFAERGYVAATVEDIARAAGCSKGAYYFHFDTKEDVLLDLLDAWAQDLSERLAKAVDGRRHPEAALTPILEALFAAQRGEGWEPHLLLEFWSQGERSPDVRRRLLRAQRAQRRLLVQAFRSAEEAGAFLSGASPEAAATVALALHQGLVLQACLGAAAGVSREHGRAALALLAGRRPLRRAG